jgi:hypothetical protein
MESGRSHEEFADRLKGDAELIVRRICRSQSRCDAYHLGAGVFECDSACETAVMSSHPMNRPAPISVFSDQRRTKSTI